MKKEKMPLNLQFFADGEPVEKPQDPPKEEPKQETPKEEQTTEQKLQEALIELAKYKRSSDKNASEAAEYKRKWKDSLSEVEKASMEKAEKEAAREERLKELERQVKVNDLTEKYIELGYSVDNAKAMAVADYDDDSDTRFKIMAQVDAEKEKTWEKNFIASRPQIAAGTGSQQEEDLFLKGFNSVKH